MVTATRHRKRLRPTLVLGALAVSAFIVGLVMSAGAQANVYSLAITSPTTASPVRITSQFALPKRLTVEFDYVTDRHWAFEETLGRVLVRSGGTDCSSGTVVADSNDYNGTEVPLSPSSSDGAVMSGSIELEMPVTAANGSYRVCVTVSDNASGAGGSASITQGVSGGVVVDVPSVLYDQNNNRVTWGPLSTASWSHPNAGPGMDSQAADDFVVPAGQTWTIGEIDAIGGGYCDNYMPSVNVFFYADAASHVPGSQIYFANVSPSGGLAQRFCDFGIPVDVTLAAGHYWVSVQAVGDTSAWGWDWANRTTISNYTAVWRNPLNGYGATGCTDWCTLDGINGWSGDVAFIVRGTSETSSGPTTSFSGVAFSADTGTSSSDFVTKTAVQTITATLSGTLAAGDAVLGSLDNGSTWTDITAKVSGTGLSWDGVTLSASNTLKLKVSNGGNDGPVFSQAYVLDTVAPTVTFSGVSLAVDSGTNSHDFITGTALQAISATLSVSLGSGELVKGSLNGGTTWTDITGKVSGTSLYWNGATLLPGTNTLELKVTDAAGNDGTVFTRVYVLDTEGPNVSITQVNGLDVTFPYTASGISSVGGACTTGDNAISVSVNDAATDPATADCSSGAWTLTLTTAISAAGSYNFAAVQSDAAGHTGYTPYRPVTIAEAAPDAPTLQAPTGPTNDATPTFTWTSSSGATSYDLEVVAKGTSCDFGGTLAVDQSSLTATSYTPSSTLPDGTYCARVSASNGTASGWSTTGEFTVDTGLPTVTLTKLNGNTVTFPHTTSETITTLGGTCTTGDGDVSVNVMGLILLSLAPLPPTASCTSGTWTFTPPLPLSNDGSYSLSASQTDAAGNTGGSGTKSLVIDKTAPAVPSWSAPTGTITDATPAISWSTVLGAATYDLRVAAKSGASCDFTGSLAINETGLTAASFTPASDLADATYCGQVRARDATANASAWSTAAEFTVDTTPADTTAPVTAIALSPASPNGSNGWYTSTVHVTVSATDATGVAETRCVLDPTTAPVSFADIPSGCAYSGTGADVTANGSHTLYAASKDTIGNTETVTSSTFQIDTSAPSVAIDTVNGSSASFPTSIIGPVTTIGGSCSSADGNVSVTVDAVPVTPTATCSVGGTWSLTLATPVSSLGLHTFVASQTDAAGNKGESLGAVVTITASAGDVLTPTDGAPLTTTEGAMLRNVVLGTFTDSNPGVPASSFSAQVCWSDGTGCTTGTVTGTNGSFTVRGSHAFAAVNTYSVVTTVTAAGANDAVIATSVTVNHASLKAGNVRVSLDKTKTQATLAATFTDDSPGADAGAYSATIGWGDGGGTTAGVITAVRNGVWSVSGGPHAYPAAGTYTVTVTVTHDSLTPVTMSATLRIR